MIRYLTLAEYLWLAEQVTGVNAAVLTKGGMLTHSRSPDLLAGDAD